MKESYLLEYINENDFRKKERSLKKYNMLAFKKLYFEYYPKLREGDFVGVLIENDTNKYILDLPTDAMFIKVHGKIQVHYTVDKNNKIVLLENITPEDILLEGHANELRTYKGVMISKAHAEKDMFKINLLNMLNK
ncbi:MAG: hypothetical protein IKV94_00320 [Clostridia bacterium]|nr:hypothetical protein [Clostridia bacterium]